MKQLMVKINDFRACIWRKVTMDSTVESKRNGANPITLDIPFGLFRIFGFSTTLYFELPQSLQIFHFCRDTLKMERRFFRHSFIHSIGTHIIMEYCHKCNYNKEERKKNIYYTPIILTDNR